MNLENARLAQVMIPVADVDQGIAFYRDVLGLRFLFAAPPRMAFFDCGGVRILIGVPPSGQHVPSGAALYFQVQDIHAVHAALEAKSVRFAAAPHVVHRTPSAELWLAEFADPDGNPLALMGEVAPGGA